MLRCGEAQSVSDVRGCPPESGQFWVQGADQKEGAWGLPVEHHLCVTSDVTQDLGHGDQGWSQG